MPGPARAAEGSLWGDVLKGMKDSAAAGRPVPPPHAVRQGIPYKPDYPRTGNRPVVNAVPRAVEAASPAEPALPPLLVVNDGKPGPVRGVVPVRIDAREDKEMAFLVLRVGDREDFLSNSTSVTRQWDTTAYPDGRYTVVAEAYAKYYLLRSAPLVIEINNAVRAAGAASGRPGGAAARALAPDAARTWPAPTTRSIAISAGGQAKLLPERLSLRGGRAYVPFRKVIKAAGGQVGWQGRQRAADAELRKHAATVTIGSTQAKRDGQSTPIDIPPYLSARRTQMPARALANLLDLAIEWVHGAKSVRLYPK